MEHESADITGAAEEQGSSLADSAKSAASAVADQASNAASQVAAAASSAVGSASSAVSSSEQAAGSTTKTVYVGNLFFDVKEDDLKKEFAKAGTVLTSKIIHDQRGLSKGYDQKVAVSHTE